MQPLKYIYHLFIKRDLVGPLGLQRYGYIGKESFIYKPAVIDRNKRNIFVGNNTTILRGSRIQLYSVDGINYPHIKFGNGCYISYNNTFLAGGNIDIEDGVLMASNILISSENHSSDPESPIYYMDQPMKCQNVVIGEGSWLGERVCILPGVTIGKKCIIGAASVVTKDIADYCIAVGSPAKIVKRYNFERHEWVKE